MMNTYIIEMVGEAREVYSVDAESEDEARERWADGQLLVSEASGMEVYSVKDAAS